MSVVRHVFAMRFYGVISTCRNVFPMVFLHVKKGQRSKCGGAI